MPKEAYLWEKTEGKSALCRLCRFNCKIADGKSGICRVRINKGGTLYSINYNKFVAAGVDPIEKKPLYHFLPATKSFSIAAAGCNFHCQFCQNWHISQYEDDFEKLAHTIDSQEIVSRAISTDCKSISYTYTEPTVFMETASDIAVLAKKSGLKNVFVSNGFMSREAIDFAADWLDGANIDLKAFTDKFYRQLTGANLEGVLDSLRYIKHNTRIHLEVTTLLIPEQNDSEQEITLMAKFIANELSPDTPWHISAYFPAYNFSQASTQPQIIRKACDIASRCGLKYVYAGNIASQNNTLCPDCGEVIISRYGYNAEILVKKTQCPKCGAKIPIILA